MNALELKKILEHAKDSGDWSKLITVGLLTEKNPDILDDSAYDYEALEFAIKVLEMVTQVT